MALSRVVYGARQGPMKGMRGEEEASPQDTSWDWNEMWLSSHLKCRVPLSWLSDLPPSPVSYWGKWEQQPPPAGVAKRNQVNTQALGQHRSLADGPQGPGLG